jgi:hypothetical protein
MNPRVELRPRFAVARQAAVDEARFDRAQPWIIDPETTFD